MALSLTKIQALTELAKHLYDYLPGSSRWPGVYTFADAARESGVGEFWQGGSKLPALTTLLTSTLERKESAFCNLVECIVRNGIAYRTKKGSPVTREDIEALNALVQKAGFKIPGLWDPEFLASLPTRPDDTPAPDVRVPDTNGESEAARRARESELLQMKQSFLQLAQEKDRAAAGLSLEKLLTRLFETFYLEPNEPFRVVGEQIDGSFLLDSEVYLVEAKWTGAAIAEADLLVFRGKVEGKAGFTRGLFISINGFSQEAQDAITRGKQPIFIMMDGADLYRVLEGHVDLDLLLRRKVRRAAETGRPFVSASELFTTRGAG